MELTNKQSLVEDFEIEGLYGYRTVGLASKHAATILIAQNGAGKTTLLAALDAFLKGQFIRLSELQFSKITCKLRGLPEPLVLLQHDLAPLSKIDGDSDFANQARQLGISPRALFEFLELVYPKIRRDYRQLHDNEIFAKITQSAGYSTPDSTKRCEDLLALARSLNPTTEALARTIKEAIGDVEIVYLPTYRRIELPLSEDGERPARRRHSVQSKLGFSRRGLFDADIRFGLSDIADRLAELNQEILVSSNQGYRGISANIINELLDGTFERFQADDSRRPDKESLTLFFSRVKEGRHAIPYRDIGQPPNLDQVYGEGATSTHAKKFLAYFLSKLDTVINATRGIEARVEEFISGCNRYLASSDSTTQLSDDAIGSNRAGPVLDDKLLVLDRRNLKVLVHSIAGNRRIPMDSLSSGEKQMISLFARLYLYEGEKIFLIDEPELSLSIDWQRKILLDLVSAPTCKQVIAITHSPFVFENALEPYARSLRLEIQAGENTLEHDELEAEIDE